MAWPWLLLRFLPVPVLLCVNTAPFTHKTGMLGQYLICLTMQALSGTLSNLFVTVVVVGVISAALANVINNQVRNQKSHTWPRIIPVQGQRKMVELRTAVSHGARGIT